ncbi:hypothetical protein HDE_01137 [Halotydeus destructor]|nr:hypothetical protein HDE_01137 [Halotydeus destructor]
MSAKAKPKSTARHLMNSMLILQPEALAWLAFLIVVILLYLSFTEISSVKKMSWRVLSACLNNYYGKQMRQRSIWLLISLLVFLLLSLHGALFQTDLVQSVDVNINSLEELERSDLKPSWVNAVTLAFFKHARNGILKRIFDKAGKNDVRHVTYKDKGFNAISRTMEIFDNNVAIINQNNHIDIQVKMLCNNDSSRHIWVSRETFGAFLFGFPFSKTTNYRTKKHFDKWVRWTFDTGISHQLMATFNHGYLADGEIGDCIRGAKYDEPSSRTTHAFGVNNYALKLWLIPCLTALLTFITEVAVDYLLSFIADCIPRRRGTKPLLGNFLKKRKRKIINTLSDFSRHQQDAPFDRRLHCGWKVDTTLQTIGHHHADPPFGHSAEIIQLGNTILTAKNPDVSTASNLISSLLILQTVATLGLVILATVVLSCLVYADCVINRKKSVFGSLGAMSWQLLGATLNGQYVETSRRSLRRIWLPISLLIFMMLSLYDALFQTDLIDISESNINSLRQLAVSDKKPSWIHEEILTLYERATGGIRKTIWKQAEKARVHHITYDEPEFDLYRNFQRLGKNGLAIINLEAHNDLHLRAFCNMSPKTRLWISKDVFDNYLSYFPFSTKTDHKTKKLFDTWQVDDDSSLASHRDT